MKQIKFDSYDDYIKAQRNTTQIKVKRPNSSFSSEESVIDSILEYHGSPVMHGLCHGVRRGEELDLFESKSPSESLWTGTEIFEDLCDGERIVCIDFTEVPSSWVGRFDLVYTNSLDHARDPDAAVQAWLKELKKPDGRLYVEWHKYHNRLGRRWNKADCYAATYEEYDELFKRHGAIEAVLSPKTKKLKRKIFVVKNAEVD